MSGRPRKRQRVVSPPDVYRFHSRGSEANARVLSNFQKCLILADDGWYPSVEHIFQARKVACSSRPELASVFMVGGEVGNKIAKEAKKAGSKEEFKKLGCVLDVQRWESVKEAAMEEAVRARLACDKSFENALVATGNKTLLHVERSGRHSEWGGCVDSETGMVVGRNKLGRLMMRLRDEVVAR